MTLFAAVAIAIIPEEHWRSRLIPAVVTGNPAAMAHWRAILEPLRALLEGRPHDDVLNFAGFDASAFQDRANDRCDHARSLEIIE